MAEPARCPHCGAAALEDAAFCVECGGRMRAPTSTPSTAPLGVTIDALAGPLPDAVSQPPPTVVAPPPSIHRAQTVVAPPPLVSAPPSEATTTPVPRPAAGRDSHGAVVPRPGQQPPPAAPRRAPLGGSTVTGWPIPSASRAPQAAPPPKPTRSASAPSTQGAVSPAPTPSGVSARAKAEASGPVKSPEPEPAEKSSRVEASGVISSRSLDEVDRRFESMMASAPTEGAELTAEELVEAQRLFREIAANYLTPVRSLMIELSLGEPSREWLALCKPPLASLRRAANDMLLTELAAALGALSTTMEQIERTNGAVLDARARESLRSAYQPLTALLPEAFAVDDERERREPIIVQSLLRQVPDVRKLALDRLYAAGLTTLEMFYKAKPADIADAAGISREIAERVVARFQRYRREVAAAPAAREAREHATLEALTRKLEAQTSSFEAAQRAFNHPEDARRIRQERAATLLEINLVLARLGQVDLVKKLERLTFRAKAEELRRFLAEAKNGL